MHFDNRIVSRLADQEFRSILRIVRGLVPRFIRADIGRSEDRVGHVGSGNKDPVRSEVLIPRNSQQGRAPGSLDRQGRR